VQNTEECNRGQRGEVRAGHTANKVETGWTSC